VITEPSFVLEPVPEVECARIAALAAAINDETGRLHAATHAMNEHRLEWTKAAREAAAARSRVRQLIAEFQQRFAANVPSDAATLAAESLLLGEGASRDDIQVV